LPQEPRWTTTIPFDNPLSKGGFQKDQNGQETVIFIDRRDNSIVVRASQEEQNIVSKYIHENDHPEPQIAIDVKIADLTLDKATTAGMDWSQLLGQAGGLTFNLKASASAASLASYASGNFTFAPAGFILSGTNATITFRALTTGDKGQAVSVPRVVTKSGVPVTIRSGVQDPVPIQTMVTGATATANQSFTSGYNMFTTGVTMDTVATVLDDGYIDLNINPAVSRQIGTKTIQGVGDVPIISTRQASTSVTVRSGQTVVIGGLFEFAATESSTGIPILERVPILGHVIFGQHAKDKTRTNLLIFVTPHLIIGGYQVDAKLSDKEDALMDEIDKQDTPLEVKPDNPAPPVKTKKQIIPKIRN
jgi:general secretion pathway protein D